MIFFYERIDGDNDVYNHTHRAKVFGGWIVRHIREGVSDSECDNVTMVFVPDVYHEWKVE